MLIQAHDLKTAGSNPVEMLGCREPMFTDQNQYTLINVSNQKHSRFKDSPKSHAPTGASLPGKGKKRFTSR